MTGHRRSALLVLLPLTAVLVLSLLVADRRQPVGVPEQPDTRPRAVVALGDSTIAGEGAGDYAPGSRGDDGAVPCHRSANAAITKVALPGVTARFNLGCSGAGTADIIAARDGAPSQAARLGNIAGRYRVEAVVLAVGANDDPRFVDVMLDCVQAWARRGDPPCSAALTQEWPRRLDAMVPRVTAAVEAVQQAMRAAGYRPGDYDLVLQSYPSPVSEDLVPALQDLSGCPLRTEDLVWIRSVAVPQLSTALRGVAERAGIRFLDLARAAEGHEACSSPDRADEWITRLTVDFELLRQEDTGLRAIAESFHPNAAGHARIAGCLSEFLSGPRREAACRVVGDRLEPRPLPATAAG